MLDFMSCYPYTAKHEIDKFRPNDVHDAELTSGQTQETAARVVSGTTISNLNRLSRVWQAVFVLGHSRE